MSSVKVGTAAYLSAAARSRALARRSASTTSLSPDFRCTRRGEAMKIEEYAPAAMPTNSARARSFSEPAPSWTVPT